MTQKLDIVHRYFEAVSSFQTSPEVFATILHPDIEQVEFPNAIVRSTQRRTLQDMLAGAQAGKALLAKHRFDIIKVIETDTEMVVEQIWTGEIGVERGPFRPGQVLTAYICTVFEFRDGLISRQRNYDCYEPF